MRGIGSRDLQALRLIDEQYALRVDQLERVLGRSGRTVQRWTRSLSERGWLELRKLLADEPAYLWLTREGQRAAGTGFGSWQPRIGRLAHIAAVVEVRLYVEERSPQSVWASERILRRELPRGEHLPDALVTTIGERHAIEVELIPKSKRRTASVIEELLGRYDRALYFCAQPARRQLEELRAEHDWPGLAVRDLPGRAQALEAAAA
jgi:hypothetical protein